MPTPSEIRIAVGTPSGRRSTVWKFSVHNNDVYILSRMFGSDAKVSLHATGICHWSATGNWIKKVAGRKNADRHMAKWFVSRPHGTVATHIFQVRIPETELRKIELTEDLKGVEWLEVPPIGNTVSLECYITPPSLVDPSLFCNLPHQPVFSAPLAGGRWFTVLHYVAPLDGKELEPLRSQMIAQAKAIGLVPTSVNRGSAFTESGGSARGLIELCPVDS
jgi:hypothetical protein